MFSALCRRLLPLALGAGFVFSAPAFSAMGETANTGLVISRLFSRKNDRFAR